ncbi:MAG: TusE/DsrC/DsvC family sulfur relay protein [Thermodesulfovibrionales bacterium]|nr:TusE/DsrC/DsvC family sulfur relay protein [Thermodesulfovibrionales bacterium]
MPKWPYKGKEYDMDEDGFLQDWEAWEEGMAPELAKMEGVELDDRHWELIRYLRDYYIKYQIAPPIKMLVKEMAKAFGPEKGNTKYLYQLFPGGPAKQACKFAGLPKPTGCV